MQQFFILLLVTVTAHVSLSAAAHEPALQQGDPAQAELKELSPAAPEELPDETTYHFHLASTSYVENDLRTSANALRDASHSLKKKLLLLGENFRAPLEASINEIATLADDVESARISSVKRLHEAFARAEIILAKHHVELAKQAWEKKILVDTAHELNASRQNFENAVFRTAFKDDGTFANLFETIRRISGKLIEEAELSPADVEKSISDVQLAITRFEIVSQPPPKNKEQ